MKRNFARLLAAALLAGLLASCSELPAFNVAPDHPHFALLPSGTVGYEVDFDENGVPTITAESRIFTFRSVGGALGRVITTYRVTFYEADGTPVLGGAEQVGSMNLFVPAGVQCVAPDAVLGCRIGDEGWRFGTGPAVASEQPFEVVPFNFAGAHINAGFPVGWYAEFVFEGVDTSAKPFTTPAYPVAFTVYRIEREDPAEPGPG